jgi:predicted DNA-binding WGR domain protein
MRRFEFVDGSSSKFWEAEVNGKTFVVVYGRIGTSGKRQEKEFPSEAAAQKEYDKKVAEKLRDGYEEIVSAAAVAATAVATPKTGLPGALPAFPTRRQVAQVRAEHLAAAIKALETLLLSLGKRSWQRSQRARQAAAALSEIAGYDPSFPSQLTTLFDALMKSVIASHASKRLPLHEAMLLLWQLDAKAFTRAVSHWGTGANTPDAARMSAVLAQASAWADAEAALQISWLLFSTKHFASLKEPLSAHLNARGESLSALLQAFSTHNNVLSSLVSAA